MKKWQLLAAVAASLAGGTAQAQVAPASAAAPVIAQTPEHLALADTLVEVAQVSRLQMKAIPQVVEMIMPMMVHGNEEHADELRTILSEEFTALFTARSGELERASRDAYARNLTDQELRDLTAFYRTPTGQHVIEIMPTILSESIRDGQEIGRRAAVEAMPRIIERMRKANLKVPDRS